MITTFQPLSLVNKKLDWAYVTYFIFIISFSEFVTYNVFSAINKNVNLLHLGAN